MADKVLKYTNSNSLFASISVYSRFKIWRPLAVRLSDYPKRCQTSNGSGFANRTKTTAIDGATVGKLPITQIRTFYSRLLASIRGLKFSAPSQFAPHTPEAFSIGTSFR